MVVFPYAHCEHDISLSFTAIIASATAGGAFFAIGIMLAQPLLEKRPENAQGYQAK